MQSWTDVFLTKLAFLGLSVHKDSVTAILHHLCVTVASGSYCLAFWGYLAVKFLIPGCFTTSNGCNCRNSVLTTLVRANWCVYVGQSSYISVLEFSPICIWVTQPISNAMKPTQNWHNWEKKQKPVLHCGVSRATLLESTIRLGFALVQKRI